jgi:hypothetical protein
VMLVIFTVMLLLTRPIAGMSLQRNYQVPVYLWIPDGLRHLAFGFARKGYGNQRLGMFARVKPIARAKSKAAGNCYPQPCLG